MKTRRFIATHFAWRVRGTCAIHERLVSQLVYFGLYFIVVRLGVKLIRTDWATQSRFRRTVVDSVGMHGVHDNRMTVCLMKVQKWAI